MARLHADKNFDYRVVKELRWFGISGLGFRVSDSDLNFGFLYFNSSCLRQQNDYTVPEADDPRPTSSAFPQRRPTAEAKGGILPDQHGEPSL